ATDLVERVGHLGQQGRLAEAGAGNERPECDSPGDGRERAQQRPGLPAPARLALRNDEGAMRAEDQVIWHEQRVDADLLGGNGDLLQLGPGYDSPGAGHEVIAVAHHQADLESAGPTLRAVVVHAVLLRVLSVRCQV